MTMASPDRRASPRIDIDGDMTYRIGDSEEGKSGRIENISTGGALIWIADDLPVDTRLLIRIDPSEPEDDPMVFRATLLHQLAEEDSEMYAYGCSIEVVKNSGD
jgi:c-di-GMP-binding flagellar brake protein YcgR